MRHRATHARLRRLQQARRRWLRARGAALCNATRSNDPAALDDMPPDDRAVLESLTDEQIEVLCAPGATLADVPELTPAQIRVLTPR
jgi:hypothetical protein